jgi:hypothetical protein
VVIRRALACLLLIAIVSAGCGSDDDSAPTAAKDEVATLVNDYFTALRAEDGGEACPLLSDRGERLLIRLAELGSGETVEDCERAASVYGKFLAEADRASDGAAKQVFAATDVSLPAEGGSPVEAEVDCRVRGAIVVEQVDGEWLISVPACVD